MEIVLGVFIAVLVLAFYMLIRNFRVCSYRGKLAQILFSAGVYDYKWRLKVYDSVSYEEMMLKFWKPLNSFYPDKTFLDLNVHKEEKPDHIKELGLKG